MDAVGHDVGAVVVPTRDVRTAKVALGAWFNPLGGIWPAADGTSEMCLAVTSAGAKALAALAPADVAARCGVAGPARVVVGWRRPVSAGPPRGGSGASAARPPAPLDDAADHDDHDDAVPAFAFVDLCAGIGGFRVACEALGGRCLLSAEVNRAARAVYAQNFPPRAGERSAGDIAQLEALPPGTDVLVAGFPCQPFSAVGKREGFACADNGGVLYHICRLLRGGRPRLFLLENVAGALAERPAIEAALAEAGYRTDVAVLDTAPVLPQTRNRAYFVGRRVEDAAAAAAAPPFAFPVLPALGRTVADVLDAAADADPAYLLPSKKKDKVASSAYFARFPRARLLDRTAAVPAQTLQATYRSGYLLYSQFVPVPAAAAVCREKPGDVDPPLTLSEIGLAFEKAFAARSTEDETEAAGASGGGDAGLERDKAAEWRFFSPREMARLQGFPSSFDIGDGAPGSTERLLGNAVAPPVVAAILGAMLGREEDGMRVCLDLVGAAA